ncbi:MAG: hypothetical protein ACKVPY_03015 [Paracoccaceae bacterium]
MRVSVLLAAAVSFAFGFGAPGRAAVIDFSATGPATDDSCAKLANVGYCDDSKFLYGWAADYLVLNDYDFATSAIFSADPGTTFTPGSVDLLYGSNTLMRLRCKAACREDPDSYAAGRADDFRAVPSEFLQVTGYLNGVSVASAEVDPASQTSLSFGAEFAGIDTLIFALSGRYPLPYESGYILDEGWLYTCASYSCYNVGLDNLSFTGTEIAPVPLPAAGGMLAAGVLMLGALARRRRR